MKTTLIIETRHVDGRQGRFTEQRIRELGEGEEMPAGAILAPDGAEAHDWQEVTE
jgi:hypothetical protein